VAVVLEEAAAALEAVDQGLAAVLAPAVAPRPVLQLEARHAVVPARRAHMAVAITGAVPEYPTLPDPGRLRGWLLHLSS
jgi:hypothetical protein